jgi:hypothetical protein
MFLILPTMAYTSLRLFGDGARKAGPLRRSPPPSLSRWSEGLETKYTPTQIRFQNRRVAATSWGRLQPAVRGLKPAPRRGDNHFDTPIALGCTKRATFLRLPTVQAGRLLGSTLHDGKWSDQRVVDQSRAPPGQARWGPKNQGMGRSLVDKPWLHRDRPGGGLRTGEWGAL